jgi:hypothetical protein
MFEGLYRDRPKRGSLDRSHLPRDRYPMAFYSDGGLWLQCFLSLPMVDHGDVLGSVHALHSPSSRVNSLRISLDNAHSLAN